MVLILVERFKDIKNRVSTKWLYFFALFSRNFFLLRTFAQFLRIKCNEFCAICAKPEIFCCEFLRMKRKEFCAIFFAQFAQNRKYYANRNFLSKLSKIEILSRQEYSDTDRNITIQTGNILIQTGNILIQTGIF